MEDSLDAALRQKWESEDKAEAAHRQYEARAIEDLAEEMLTTTGQSRMRSKGLDLLEDWRYDVLPDYILLRLIFGTLDEQAIIRDQVAERLYTKSRQWLTETDEGQALVNDRVWDMERERDGK